MDTSCSKCDDMFKKYLQASIENEKLLSEKTTLRNNFGIIKSKIQEFNSNTSRLLEYKAENEILKEFNQKLNDDLDKIQNHSNIREKLKLVLFSRKK